MRGYFETARPTETLFTAENTVADLARWLSDFLVAVTGPDGEPEWCDRDFPLAGQPLSDLVSPNSQGALPVTHPICFQRKGANEGAILHAAVATNERPRQMLDIAAWKTFADFEKVALQTALMSEALESMLFWNEVPCLVDYYRAIKPFVTLAAPRAEEPAFGYALDGGRLEIVERDDVVWSTRGHVYGGDAFFAAAALRDWRALLDRFGFNSLPESRKAA